MELIIASNNPGKIAEIHRLLPHLNLRTMREVGFSSDIDEPFHTFRENALQKAQTIHQWSGKPVLADDSGICITALDGRPGVLSARFAGVGASDNDNNELLLRSLHDSTDRSAYYIAIICLIVDGDAHFFEGKCAGSIATESRGSAGFGYDPLFIPNGFEHTFGELDHTVKARISHRAAALRQLADSGLLTKEL